MKRYGVFAFFLVAFWAYHGMAATFNPTNEAEFNTALTTAQSNGESDIIELGAGTITLTNVLYYSASENFSLIIRGAGAGLTILDGNGVCSILDISTTPTDSSAHITVRGITFQNGMTNS
ncbi:MAG: hypothetical protein MUE70_12480 [Desulfobacterales bacterium]|jgi:hypothetical protein|nr:hypothetical protein [Desulfobacterales bacterium]